jgi:hypothetical protein
VHEKKGAYPGYGPLTGTLIPSGGPSK